MNREAFYAEVRKAFGPLKQGQVDGIEVILAASEGRPRSHRAYLLATAYHETGTAMQPIKETVMPSHRDKNPSDVTVAARLEKAWKAGRLKWVKTPYWRPDAQGKYWFGRGYVQLTHRDNYARAGAMVGVDLLGDPNRALNQTVAAKILVEGCEIGLFTGKKLADYLPGNYREARRVVNGLDQSMLIAGYAERFERALQAAGVSEAPIQPKPAQPAQTAKKPAADGLSVAVGAAVVGGATVAAAFWDRIRELFQWLFG